MAAGEDAERRRERIARVVALVVGLMLVAAIIALLLLGARYGEGGA